jgi:hypothetical protein
MKVIYHGEEKEELVAILTQRILLPPSKNK